MDHGAAFTNLTNHFLVAMPGIKDELFASSVIYIYQHSPDGAMGLIVNKPADVDVAKLFARLQLPLARTELAGQQVLRGGPVQPEHGFVLHDPMLAVGLPEGETAYIATVRVAGGLEMTRSRDVLEALSVGSGPRRVLIALGCSVWGAGQLEAELERGSWLAAPADDKVIFDVPAIHRYACALALMGLQAWMISPEAGHA
ncbi:MAG: YqgE/AlgH family protein [Burkholderiaceae bacterium]|nr:YqgE/AlgH family protein [Burkholderiaceae bacterium]